MKQYRQIKLTTDILNRIKSLASKGFSEKAISMTTGIEMDDIYRWKQIGIRCGSIPDEQKTDEDRLYAKYFSVIQMSPGDTFYG